MKDQLEKFVSDNRTEFDREVPNLKVWANIEKEINPPPKRWTMWWNMGIAASVVFLLGIGTIIGMNLNTPKQDAIAILGEESEEYLEMQKFYQSQVQEKVAQLANYNMDATVSEDMEQIDDFLEELKQELNNAVKGSEEQIINAMINNYQTKLAILERVLQRVKSTKQDSNKKDKDDSINI